jgi:hypothetical protein
MRIIALLTLLILPSMTFAQGAFNPRDLNGYWELTNEGRPANAPNTVSANRPPMTDWAKEVFAKTKTGYRELSTGVQPEQQRNDPAQWCDPIGVPRILFNAKLPGMRFAQARDEVIQFFESGRVWREIWTDGRKVASMDELDGRWYGYAVGRWDGDTFVVTSNGYLDRTWIDQYGSPHSDQMVVEERYRRTDRDHVELVINITDPMAYTGTWRGDKRVFVRVEKPTRSDSNDFDENLCVWSEVRFPPRP